MFSSCRPGKPEAARTATPIPGPEVNSAADELGNPLTPYEDIISYTSYYEFSTSKTGPTQMAQDLQTSPWKIHVGGLVNKPQTFDLDSIRTKFQTQEHIYCMRCVEAWSMVIPWNYFRFSELVEIVEAKSEAQYIRFETLYDP